MDDKINTTMSKDLLQTKESVGAYIITMLTNAFNLNTLWAYSADDKLTILFSFFPENML